MGDEEKLAQWITAALWWDNIVLQLYFNILLNNDILYSLKVGQWVNLITFVET